MDNFQTFEIQAYGDDETAQKDGRQEEKPSVEPK